MSEAGGKGKYNKKQWYSGGQKVSGAGRGGRGRGRGGGGGRGGRGGGRGGFGGGDRGDSSSGDKKGHLGRYRDSPLADIMFMPGIMATAIQNKEKSAERELMECLEQVADELYPETIEKEEENDDEDDLEAMLQKELAGMKSDTKSKRFRLCIHETTCVFYVVVLEPLDPVRLVYHILEQTERTAKCPFRFLKRIVPISAAANATLPSLRTAAIPVLEKGFSSPNNENVSYKYGIMPNSRSSNKLDRLDMIRTVADLVGALPGGHKVDLKDQERTIMIELYKGRVGISVVQDYYRFLKYNPIQIAEQTAAARGLPAPNSEETTETSTAPAQTNTNRAAMKHAGRDARAAEIANSATRTGDASSTQKRKVEVEDGEVILQNEEDVEIGEVVEGQQGDSLEGEEWEEIIQDGKLLKMRKVD